MVLRIHIALFQLYLCFVYNRNIKTNFLNITTIAWNFHFKTGYVYLDLCSTYIYKI